MATLSVVFACASLPAPAAAATAFIQAAASAAHGTPSSLSLSFPGKTGAGNLLLLGFDFNGDAVPTSVTDSQGNVYTAVGNQLTTPGGAHSRVYYANNIKGGADTVTVTLSAPSSYLELYFTEYSGLDPTNPIDTQVSATGPAGDVSSGYGTTTESGDVIYGYCTADWGCTPDPRSTARSTLDGNLIEESVAGDPGSYAAIASANNGWSMQMVALRPAASSSPVITSAATANGQLGAAFSYQITASNSPTSYGATGLPPGLSVNGTTGAISGIPASAGTSVVTLSASGAGGTATGSLTVNIKSQSAVWHIQSTSTAAHGTPSSLSLSFPGKTGAGDLLLLGFDFNGDAVPTSVTDSQGNVYTAVGNQLTTPGGAHSRVYYANNIKGGADTVTVTLSAPSSYLELYFTEYSGLDPTNPIDTQVSATGPAGDVSSGYGTTTESGDVIYGYCTADWGCTSDPRFTARSTLDGNLIEESVAGGPGSYAAIATANNGWSMQMIALRPATSTPSVPSGTAAVSLSPPSLSFSSLGISIPSVAQVVTLTNSGSATLNISGITIVGANPGDFTENDTCGSSLAAGANCTIVVLFTPLALGGRSAALSISDSANATPQTVSLLGGGSHNVVLTWSASPSSGVIGYNVYRGTASGGESSTPLNSAPVNALTFTDGSVTPGTKYYYVLTSVTSSYAESGGSGEASAAVPSP